jgi:hypothetical protein
MYSRSIGRHEWQQFFPQTLIVKMPRRILGQAEFNRRCELLRGLIAVAVHVPTSLCKPVFELVERHFLVKVFRELLTNLIFGDH